MSHEIYGSDGMAYVGETPWHGLGNVLQPGASIEEWKTASGLVWQVRHEPVFLADGTEIEGRYAVRRQDTGKVFSFASDRRKDIQPGEILEFFRDVSGLPLETAGSLKEGAIVWALATKGDGFKVKGEDHVKSHLLLSTSFDGSMATTGRWTSIRVVCNNTLRMAMRDKSAVKVRHTTMFDEAAVKAQLGVYEEQSAEFERAANLLAERKVTGAEVESLLLDLFGSFRSAKPQAEGEAPVLTTYSQNVMEDVTRCIVTSPGANFDTARGTAWGVLNGITNYVDFHARAHNEDNRLHSAWFGNGDALKADAFARVRELVPALAA